MEQYNMSQSFIKLKKKKKTYIKSSNGSTVVVRYVGLWNNSCSSESKQHLPGCIQIVSETSMMNNYQRSNQVLRLSFLDKMTNLDCTSWNNTGEKWLEQFVLQPALRFDVTHQKSQKNSNGGIHLKHIQYHHIVLE